MPQQFRPDLDYMVPDFELSASARKEIKAHLHSHLRDSGDEGAAIQALEVAIAEYRALLGAGVNDRLRRKQATLGELDAVSAAAGALSEALQNLHSETRGRLTEVVEHAPGPGEEHGPAAPLVDRRRLGQLAVESGMLAGRAGLVRSRVEKEERSRGRPPDQAAWDLASTCLGIFERHCEGSTAQCTFDGYAPGPFQELLGLVFAAAGIKGSADYYVRKLHERTAGTGV